MSFCVVVSFHTNIVGNYFCTLCVNGHISIDIQLKGSSCVGKWFVFFFFLESNYSNVCLTIVKFRLWECSHFKDLGKKIHMVDVLRRLLADLYE